MVIVIVIALVLYEDLQHKNAICSLNLLSSENKYSNSELQIDKLQFYQESFAKNNPGINLTNSFKTIYPNFL